MLKILSHLSHSVAEPQQIAIDIAVQVPSMLMCLRSKQSEQSVPFSLMNKGKLSIAPKHQPRRCKTSLGYSRHCQEHRWYWPTATAYIVNKCSAGALQQIRTDSKLTNNTLAYAPQHDSIV